MNSDQPGDKPLTTKIALIGDSGVGKSSLLHKYRTKDFFEDFPVTVLEEYNISCLGNHGKQKLHINIWDVTGLYDFAPTIRIVLGIVDAVLVCYSCDNLDSLKNVENIWLPELKRTNSNVPFLLVGTKLDLVDRGNNFSRQAIRISRWFEAYAHLQCSAKTGDVKKVFDSVIIAALKSSGQIKVSNNFNFNISKIFNIGKFKGKSEKKKETIPDVPNPLPKSLQIFFGSTESMWISGTNRNPLRSKAWRLFLNLFTGSMSKEHEVLLSTFKIGVYMVIRLNEAVGSIFKSHPLRGRGSMFVSVLAWKYSTLIQREITTLGGPAEEFRSKETVLMKSHVTEQTKDPHFQQKSKLFRKTSQFRIRPGPTQTGNTVRDRAVSSESIETYRSEAAESIHSALSIFSHSVQEKEEKSIHSGFTHETNGSDEFLDGYEFRDLLNEILEKHGYVEVKTFLGSLISLKMVLNGISSSAAAYVNNVWRPQKIFNPVSRDDDVENSALLVQATLAILHEANADLCQSSRNQFQHSRFVKQMQSIKRKTQLTQGLFKQWVASSELLNAINNRFHPTNILEQNLRNKMSAELYNKQELDNFEVYHLKKMRDNQN